MELQKFKFDNLQIAQATYSVLANIIAEVNLVEFEFRLALDFETRILTITSGPTSEEIQSDLSQQWTNFVIALSQVATDITD